MTEKLDEAMRDARSAAGGGPADGMVSRLVEKVGGVATSEAVFGMPVERDGVTVIPVGKVRWGAGGGEGSNLKHDDSADGHGDGEIKTDSGSGGGGGAMASPAGYIEIRDGYARFIRIHDWAGLWPIVLAGGAAGWMLLRGLRALVR